MNNRQAGRRRGRGGQRQGGNPGRPDNGNRIDSRARGNAAQLLEKFKNLAQDAQRSGDRVTTEYYLQFADHYFRVLAESRSRMEDGQQRRQPNDDDDAEGVEDFGFEGELGSPAYYQQPQQTQPRQQDGDREERPRRDRDGNGGYGGNFAGDRDRDRDDRPRQRDDQQQQRDVAPRRDRDSGGEIRPRREREASNDQGDDRPRREPRGYGRDQAAEPRADSFAGSAADERPAAANDEPRRRGRPRRDAVPVESEGFDAAVLPPAISAEPAAVGDTPDRPRRGRPRKVRIDDEAVPPAA